MFSSQMPLIRTYLFVFVMKTCQKFYFVRRTKTLLLLRYMYIRHSIVIEWCMRVCKWEEEASRCYEWSSISLSPTQRGKWAVYVPTAENINLEFHACPAGYCHCTHNSSIGENKCVYTYSTSDPDLQCNCGRRGKA